MNDDWSKAWDERCKAHPSWPEFWKAWKARAGSHAASEGHALIVFGERLGQQEIERERAKHDPSRHSKRKLALEKQRQRLETENAKAIGDLRKQLSAATTRIDDLRENQISYAGTHKAGEWYRRGEIVTRSGVLWIAETATQATPGAAGDGWKMMHKSVPKVRTRKEPA